MSPTPEASLSPTTPSLPTPRRRRGLRLLAGAAALVAASPMLLWHSETATAWALRQVPGLQVDGWQGSPGHGPMQAQRLLWESSAGRLEITDLQAQGLQWHWQSGSNPQLKVTLPVLQITRLQWQAKSTPQATSNAPSSLRLPLRLAVPQVRIETLHLDGLPVLQDLQAALHLGADVGQTHRLEQLRTHTDRFSVEASGQVGVDGPLPLQAQLELHSLPGGPAWQAKASAQGPLAQFNLSAELQGQAPTASAATPTTPARVPSLQAQAQIRPFEAWPLGDLSLRTQALDLAALLTGLPRTELEGEVKLRTSGLNQAAQADIRLSNAAAGRWDQGWLPVRRLQATLSGTPSPLSHLNGTHLQLELGDARAAAGLITGQADWQAPSSNQAYSQTALALNLQQVTPAALDQRAPAMMLSGPLTLKFDTPTEATLALGWTLDTRLEGRLTAAVNTAPAASLSVKAQGQGNRLTIEHAALHAGTASAHLKAELSRQDEQWRWQAEGRLQDFDPALWWPGSPDSAWRRGPHRLQAALSTSGQATLALLSQPEQLWRAGAAKLALTLEPSVLAGVPLQGQLSLTPAAGGGKGLYGSEGLLQLSAGRNTLSAQVGANAGAPLRATLSWPDMASLAPLFKLYPGSAAWAPTEGDAEVSLEAIPQSPQAWTWRWASKIKAVRTPSMSLGSGQLTGQGQTGGAAQEGHAELSLTADKLQGEPWQIDHLQADLSGSLAQHRLKLQVLSPARPPAWFEQILGAKTGGGSQVSADLQGQWRPAAPEKKPSSKESLAGRWMGQVLSLQGRSTDAASQAWLSAEKLGLSLDLDAGGRLQAADVQPGRVALPGAAITWAHNQWRWTEQGQARGRLEAQIEPFAIAPLLARAQPELGWQGDLILGADLKISREQEFDADIVFERRSGDLSVASDSLGTAPRRQALGLTDLRLGLAAHKGVWHFTQGLAGQKLGELAGVATVRTRPELAWPPADAPLDGVWQMRVAELGAWGTWVPPGWRLGGELRSAASLGGRFGAPELTGQISGEGLTLRNVLEGVHLRDGDVDIRLQGASAQIERFTFKGGAGSVRLTGGASLGADPKAQLKLAMEQFQVLARIDRKVVISGEAEVELNRDAAKVTGDVRVDEGLIDVSQESAAQLPDDVTVLSPQSDKATRSTEPSTRRKLGLALKVELGDKLRLKGRGLDTLLRGDLKLVTSAAGVLSVAGAVRAEQGTYAAYGQKLKIERGVLRFVGPVDDPRLDVFAVRPNIDVVVGVAVTGSALNPRIRLASEPDMPETTKLSWLVLGREPDGLGQADTALLQRAAIALLAGEGEAPTDAMLGAIGITDFSVRQTGTGEARETVVALGKQLSQRWWVGYERSINSTTGTWQLIYRAAQRFTLRAQSGEDHALDLIWTWRWNPTPAKK